LQRTTISTHALSATVDCDADDYHNEKFDDGDNNDDAWPEGVQHKQEFESVSDNKYYSYTAVQQAEGSLSLFSL
jgi:hypothetical protein